jgi:hypothetical protein
MQRVSKARQVWTGKCDTSVTNVAALVALVGWLTGTPEGGRALCRGFSAGGSWPSRRLSSNTSSPAARRCCIINNELTRPFLLMDAYTNDVSRTAH